MRDGETPAPAEPFLFRPRALFRGSNNTGDLQSLGPTYNVSTCPGGLPGQQHATEDITQAPGEAFVLLPSPSISKVVVDRKREQNLTPLAQTDERLGTTTYSPLLVQEGRHWERRLAATRDFFRLMRDTPTSPCGYPPRELSDAAQIVFEPFGLYTLETADGVGNSNGDRARFVSAAGSAGGLPSAEDTRELHFAPRRRFDAPNPRLAGPLPCDGPRKLIVSPRPRFIDAGPDGARESAAHHAPDLSFGNPNGEPRAHVVSAASPAGGLPLAEDLRRLDVAPRRRFATPQPPPTSLSPTGRAHSSSRESTSAPPRRFAEIDPGDNAGPPIDGEQALNSLSPGGLVVMDESCASWTPPEHECELHITPSRRCLTPDPSAASARCTHTPPDSQHRTTVVLRPEFLEVEGVAEVGRVTVPGAFSFPTWVPAANEDGLDGTAESNRGQIIFWCPMPDGRPLPLLWAPPPESMLREALIGRGFGISEEVRAAYPREAISRCPPLPDLEHGWGWDTPPEPMAYSEQSLSQEQGRGPEERPELNDSPASSGNRQTDAPREPGWRDVRELMNRVEEVAIDLLEHLDRSAANAGMTWYDALGVKVEESEETEE